MDTSEAPRLRPEPEAAPSGSPTIAPIFHIDGPKFVCQGLSPDALLLITVYQSPSSQRNGTWLQPSPRTGAYLYDRALTST
jgi:hypothetical protein